MTIIKNISIYHSLDCLYCLGFLKKYIKKFQERTIVYQELEEQLVQVFLLVQGMQMIRVHDVNEINQSIKVFKELIK